MAGSSSHAVAAVVSEVIIINKKFIINYVIYIFNFFLKILFTKSSLFIYLPAILILLIRIVGEFIRDLNSKSLASLISLNIFLIFPATVISLIG